MTTKPIIHPIRFTRRLFTRRLLASTAAASMSPLLAACSTTEPDHDDDDIEWDEEFDVIIIGAGGAGMVAAIEATDAGASVLMLEKTDITGGNTVLSGGLIQAAGTSFQEAAGVSGDTPAKHRAYYEQAGEGVPEPELLEVLTNDAPAAIEFMVGLGLDYLTVYGVDPIPYVDEELMVPRIHVPGSEPEVGGGATQFMVLQTSAEQRGVEIRTSSPVLALLESEDEGVVGVHAEVNGKPTYIRARRAVILATGGFDRNPELARSLSPQLLWELETGTPFTAPSNTGDGLLMGMAMGADLAGLGGTIGYPAVRPGTGTVPGIWINRYGQRFVNEGSHYAYAIRAVYDQEQHLAWAVFDQNVADMGGAALGGLGVAWSDDLSAEIASGKLETGATLEELAAAIDVDANELVRTMAQWNEAALAGEDHLFNRSEGLVALDTGPYYATRVVSANLGSCGGLRIDTDCRVIDVDQDPIPGLFAAGMVAGGFIGPYYPGSGTALLATVVFGRIAGKQAAASRQA